MKLPKALAYIDDYEPTIHEQVMLPHWSEAEAVLYRYFDHKGTLLYVGVTGDLTTRMQGHGRVARWWTLVDHSRTQLDWYWSRDQALRAESLAIRSENPPWNVQGRIVPGVA
jgi:predicted GIY-YIG superfamily endonuclease